MTARPVPLPRRRSLRLEIVVRSYKEGDRWTWRLKSQNHEVIASSGSQRFTHRIDAARGAELGTMTMGVAQELEGRGRHGHGTRAWVRMGTGFRRTDLAHERVEIWTRDERRSKP